MKIGELAKQTGISKETIHYYIREGVLKKPRKTGKNTADYGPDYIDQIRIIKALRENYFLPIPVIRKLIKKHKKKSGPEQSSFQFLSQYFRPLDQLFFSGVAGRKAFIATTGLSEKWLSKMEEWKIITSEEKDGEIFYSHENVVIGKLLVDMDHIGIGPSDGFDPKELKHFTQLFRQMVAKNIDQTMKAGWDRMSAEDLSKKGSQSTEVMSLFFYHFYRKLVKEEYRRYLASQIETAS